MVRRWCFGPRQTYPFIGWSINIPLYLFRRRTSVVKSQTRPQRNTKSWMTWTEIFRRFKMNLKNRNNKRWKEKESECQIEESFQVLSFLFSVSYRVTVQMTKFCAYLCVLKCHFGRHLSSIFFFHVVHLLSFVFFFYVFYGCLYFCCFLSLYIMLNIMWEKCWFV